MTEVSDKQIRVMRIIARLNIGGPAVHAAVLTAGLNDAIFKSILVTGSIGEAEGDMAYMAERYGVEPVYIPALQRKIAPLQDVRALIQLIRLIRQEKPHIVHTHTAKAGFVGRLAAVLCGAPVILHTFHGHVFHSYFGRAKTALFIGLERLAARYSDLVLTISDRLRNELLEYRITTPGKIKVIPLGLPLSELADLEPVRGQFRAEHGISPEQRLVGIVGRLVPVKRHDVFLDAARIAAEALPDSIFLVIGDGELREELEAQAHGLNLEGRVIFTGWQRDLSRVYADLDLVVISSDNEGTPVSLIEAMAAGVPVISTTVGGVPDLLQEGQLGRLVPPADSQALAKGIITALAEPDSEQIEKARQAAIGTYNAAHLVENMRSLYIRLIGQHTKPGQEKRSI
nr:glycosyltransferase family 4 protein [Anaerolineae bacterium]